MGHSLTSPPSAAGLALPFDVVIFPFDVVTFPFDVDVLPLDVVARCPLAAGRRCSCLE